MPDRHGVNQWRVDGSRITYRSEHRWTRTALSAYLHRDLAPTKWRRLERHAARCAECRGVLRSVAIPL